MMDGEDDQNGAQVLHDLEQEAHQWQVVLEEYPGTEYARLAQEHLSRLMALKHSIQLEDTSR
jgi:hypothetical protein